MGPQSPSLARVRRVARSALLLRQARLRRSVALRPRLRARPRRAYRSHAVGPRDRPRRTLASLINVLDPDVVVLGGGMSNIAGLPEAAYALLLRYVFAAGAGSDPVATRVVRAAHGDSSGVRGA